MLGCTLQFSPAPLLLRSLAPLLLGQRRLAGLHVAIDAHRRGEEVAGHAHLGGGVGHMNVNQRVVAQHLALGHGNEAHAAHIGGQLHQWDADTRRFT